ncbi:hypothetical protein D3C81_1927010 [compost metagenome]
MTDEPLLPVAFKPPKTTLPCASAYVSLSAARNCVSSKVPPRKLFASPSDETVTSMAWPRRYPGGNTALTMTVATFLLFDSAPSGIFTPNCLSMLTTDWLENFTWVVSPLPFRPTTRP